MKVPGCCNFSFVRVCTQTIPLKSTGSIDFLLVRFLVVVGGAVYRSHFIRFTEFRCKSNEIFKWDDDSRFTLSSSHALDVFSLFIQYSFNDAHSARLPFLRLSE